MHIGAFFFEATVCLAMAWFSRRPNSPSCSQPTAPSATQIPGSHSLNAAADLQVQLHVVYGMQLQSGPWERKCAAEILVQRGTAILLSELAIWSLFLSYFVCELRAKPAITMPWKGMPWKRRGYSSRGRLHKGRFSASRNPKSAAVSEEDSNGGSESCDSSSEIVSE